MKPNSLRSSVILGFFILDASALVLAYQAAFYTRFHWDPFLTIFPITKGYPGPEIYQQALLALLPIWLAIFIYTKTYKAPFIGAYDEFIRILKTIILCSLVAA